MENTLIPFPNKEPAPELDAIRVRRSRTLVSVGTSRYAIDVTVTARASPPRKASVTVLKSPSSSSSKPGTSRQAKRLSSKHLADRD
jgi:hypothetical protein